MDAETELSLVDLVDISHKARLRTLSGSKRGRKKFVNDLYHHAPFDGRYVWELSYSESFDTYAHLVNCGALDECYLMSARSEIDGVTMRLEDALAEPLEATILICIPGRLAYYTGEDGFERWIVRRSP